MRYPSMRRPTRYPTMRRPTRYPTMRRPVLVLLLVGGMLASVVRPVRADVTAEQVRTAIDRAVDHLRREQRPNGSWLDLGIYPGGVTALCTLALLNAGVEPEEETIERALNFLRKLRSEKTYVVALQTMVFCQASPERDRAAIERNVRWLEKTQIQSGRTRGSWSYPGRSGDNSNSQFALLALHEAERVGVKVDGRTWRQAKAHWEKTQNPEGSWGYVPGAPGTGSMTSAGIASLVITANKVGQQNAQVEGDRIRCCQEAEDDDARIRRALQWLGSDRVFSVTHNPGRPEGWTLYYLYALERVGRLTARRFIGQHDWYREGAEHLLKIKGATSDHWVGVGPHEGSDARIATAMALLFLAKGRRPVLLSKLKHGAADVAAGWNAHKSDVANLTHHVESRWKHDMIWQVVDLDAATVEDLLEAPVLYFCGSKSPMPSSKNSQEKLSQKLRDYIDRGGFLFAEAYCDGVEFDRGFRQLIELVFPEPDYRLALLPPVHPIWRTEEAVDAKYVRPIWGIEFGCRTSLVYFPPVKAAQARPSLSCLWELSRGGRDTRFAPSVQARIEAGLAIGNNVLAYATNQELKFKDPATPKLAQHTRDAFPRGHLYLANIRHLGGCDAAPRALVTLLETARKELHIRTHAEKREVNLTDEALFDYPMVFFHGRASFHLTDAERKQLRTYVERGGVVFANAICASRSFAESFRREMALTFPEHPLARIPGDASLLTPEFGGFDLSKVTRRDPQPSGSTEPLKDLLREVSPELDGIQLDNRYGVIFSRYDLSCALEKRNSIECQGYVRKDAARICLNILLYSLQQ